jgi:hypothetical protein
MLTTPACNTSANEYIEKMFKALDTLGTLNEQYRTELSDSIDKFSAFKMLYATILLEEKASADKMTVDELKAKVTKRVNASEKVADIAEALCKGTREAMELQKETIGVCQSALGYAKSELEATPNANPTEPIWRGVT